MQKLSAIWSSGVSAVQGLLSIEVNVRTVGTFSIVHFISITVSSFMHSRMLGMVTNHVKM